MGNYQKVKGTLDFYGNEVKKIDYVEKKAKELARNYGFVEIRTPIFENTEVFTRSSGDESDIVSKEMYTFLDKGNRSITLRPEGTAPVARCFIENKMYANTVGLHKFFYVGPMFRYERPQAGRYRQFNQFGVEAYGDLSPMADADVIISAYNLFRFFKIKGVKLVINCIGDFESRTNYSKALKDYFLQNIDTMCEDCKRRVNTNPMRILDCKVDKNNPVLTNCPKIKDYLTESSKEYFKTVLDVLDRCNIPYIVDEKLVRGLDYYTDTVFEYILENDSELNGLAICAGGKYSDLIKSLNGPDLPGIGYAFGIERIAQIADDDIFDLSDEYDVFIMGLDEESKLLSLEIVNKLRIDGFKAEIDYKNYSMKSQFKLAEKLKAKYIIIIGEEERKNNTVSIKNVATKTQDTIRISDIENYIRGNK